jgi:hypothetical protein
VVWLASHGEAIVYFRLGFEGRVKKIKISMPLQFYFGRVEVVFWLFWRVAGGIFSKATEVLRGQA